MVIDVSYIRLLYEQPDLCIGKYRQLVPPKIIEIRHSAHLMYDEYIFIGTQSYYKFLLFNIQNYCCKYTANCYILR